MKENLFNWRDQSAYIISKAAEEDLMFSMCFAAKTCIGKQWLLSSKEDMFNYLLSIIKRHHYSILEHATVSVKLITSRAVANQIVRHRIAAYAQESMRYVRFFEAKDSCPQDKLLEMIPPYDYDNWTEESKNILETSINSSCKAYIDLTSKHCIKAEDARNILPLMTKTVLVATWSIRELFHILFDDANGRLINKHAQPQTKELFSLLLENIKEKYPYISKLAYAYYNEESIN